MADRDASLEVRADASQSEREVEKLQKAIRTLGRDIKKLNSESRKPLAVNTQKATREMNRFSNTARHSFGALAAFNTFTATTSGILSGAFVFAVGSVANSLVKLGAEAESTRERFLALSDSIVEGKRQYEEFYNFAKDRGLQFKGLVEAANQLRVVGFGGEDLQSLIREIGIVAGDSRERVERITRALGQMRAFGRVALEELNQLTEAGVPIISAIADQLDVPEGAVRGLIELGKIDFATVRAAFSGLTDESGKFFASSEAQSDTLQASFNRLKNATFILSDAIVKDLSGALIGFVEGTASIAEFFASTQGKIEFLSFITVPAAITALGGLGIVFGKVFGTPTSNPAVKALEAVTGQIRSMAIEVFQSEVKFKSLRVAVRTLGIAMKTAFTGPLALLSAAAAVAIPLLINHFVRLREEAEKIDDLFTSLEQGFKNLTPDDKDLLRAQLPLIREQISLNDER